MQMVDIAGPIIAALLAENGQNVLTLVCNPYIPQFLGPLIIRNVPSRPSLPRYREGIKNGLKNITRNENVIVFNPVVITGDTTREMDKDCERYFGYTINVDSTSCVYCGSLPSKEEAMEIMY